MLLDSPMFQGFTMHELDELLTNASVCVHLYERGEVIYQEGNRTRHVGIILTGYVDLVQEDYWGNSVLLGRFRPGQSFADSFIFSRTDSMLYSAIAAVKTSILMLPFEEDTLEPRELIYPHQLKLFNNLLYISAKKNVGLLSKINLLTRPNVREKLMYYLTNESRKAGSNRFTISLNRQGMANLLAMDRSTLSSELSKLQQEGIVTIDKNTFELHRNAS